MHWNIDSETNICSWESVWVITTPWSLQPLEYFQRWKNHPAIHFGVDDAVKSVWKGKFQKFYEDLCRHDVGDDGYG